MEKTIHTLLNEHWLLRFHLIEAVRLAKDLNVSMFEYHRTFAMDFAYGLRSSGCFTADEGYKLQDELLRIFRLIEEKYFES